MYIKEMIGDDLVKNIELMKVIDARTKEEYDAGHIDGAINIPYDEILEHLDELDKNEPIIIHCRTNQRSQFAAMSLMGVGYEHIYVAPGVEMYEYDLVK